jgi:hypothetical protein
VVRLNLSQFLRFPATLLGDLPSGTATTLWGKIQRFLLTAPKLGADLIRGKSADSTSDLK